MSLVFKLETFTFLIFAKVSKPKMLRRGLYSSEYLAIFNGI